MKVQKARIKTTLRVFVAIILVILDITAFMNQVNYVIHLTLLTQLYQFPHIGCGICTEGTIQR